MDNAVTQFVTNCHFCCFEGFAKDLLYETALF